MSKTITTGWITDKINGIAVSRIACSSKNYAPCSSRTVSFLAVHYTGNAKDTATGNGNYFKNNSAGASAHLFVDDSGTALINLNGWERKVIAEEEQQEDFVCWLRNPSRGSWALCIPYEIDGETKPTYPDFLIIRRDGPDYVVDILEPHDPTRVDNLGKAKGFAEYARQNPGVGRIQLIRMQRDSVGREKAFRLDMSKSSIRDKVSRCASNDELNHIFESDGFFQ